MCTFRTRPAVAAAMASSSSRRPSSHRPASTVARPSTLTASTSRSLCPLVRPTARARVACVICSCTDGDWRARSTATQPCPAHAATPSSARSERASQPRAAEGRPPIMCWWDTQTAARTASSQRPRRT